MSRPILTALPIPAVASHSSAQCLQWSADGQVAFVTETSVIILTPDHGINFDNDSVVRATPVRDDTALGWFKTAIQSDPSRSNREPDIEPMNWPDYSQNWGTVSLGSIDFSLINLAISPSELSPTGHCIFATLTSNMDVMLWTASKNYLKGKWEQIFALTPFLLNHFAPDAPECTAAEVIQTQITTMNWTPQADFGLEPKPHLDGSLLILGSRAGDLTFLRYRNGENPEIIKTLSVSDYWITHIAFTGWKVVHQGKCEGHLAYATSRGSVGIVTVTQTAEEVKDTVSYGPTYTIQCQFEHDENPVYGPEARAGITAFEWAHVSGRSPILVTCTPGLVKLYSARTLPDQRFWTGHRSLRVQMQQIYIGCSPFHPVSGITVLPEEDAMVVTLADGSFHVVEQMTTDPVWREKPREAEAPVAVAVVAPEPDDATGEEATAATGVPTEAPGGDAPIDTPIPAAGESSVTPAPEDIDMDADGEADADADAEAEIDPDVDMLVDTPFTNTTTTTTTTTTPGPPPRNPDGLDSTSLSQVSRDVFVRAEDARPKTAREKEERRTVDRVDMGGITAVRAYDGDGCFMWTYEASRPSDFSYKHDAKHYTMFIVSQMWDAADDDRLLQTLERLLTDVKAGSGVSPLHILRPVFIHLRDTARLDKLHARLLTVLNPQDLTDNSTKVIAPEWHGGELTEDFRKQFRASLTTNLFGWDDLLSLRMRLSMADFAWKLASSEEHQMECGIVAQALLSAISHRILRTLIRYLLSVVKLLTSNEMPFVSRIIVQSLLPGCPEDLREEGNQLSSAVQPLLNGSNGEGDADEDANKRPSVVGKLNETCPACGLEVQLQQITHATCPNGHTWPRCSVTTFILATPSPRTCVGCSRKAFLPPSVKKTLPPMAQGWVVEDLLEAVQRCLFCNNGFVSIL